MKKINEAFNAEKDARANVAAQRTQIIDFVGQALANEYNVSVGELGKPNLVLTINGQQFAVNVVSREKAVSLDGARATFTPEK